MSDQARVLAANATFYSAMRSGDLGTMESLWARRRRVTCTHPSGPALLGRRDVMESWSVLLAQGKAVPVRCRDPLPIVTGATAIVLCEEWIGNDLLMAVNGFALEGGIWRMTDHSAAPVPGKVR